MRAPLVKVAALGVVGFALWKIATILVFPVVGALLGLLIKGALIVAVVLFAMWFFKKRREQSDFNEQLHRIFGVKL